jgi:hypothetical protein
MQLNLQGRGVVQLHKAAAIEEGRLSQIDMRHVTTETGPKMRCAATDGRILAVVDLSYEFGVDMPGRVSQEAWATAAKLKPNKKGCMGPELRANGTVEIVGKDGEAIKFERPSADGDFPRYEAVIPEIRPGAIKFGINSLLFASVCDAIGANKDDPTVIVTVNDPDQETPQLVAMAKRASDELDQLIAWTPEPYAAPDRHVEQEESDEAYAERCRIDRVAFDTATAAAIESHGLELKAGAAKLVRCVTALRPYPERPSINTPILVTRLDLPEAKGVIMPVTVEAPPV